MVAKHSYLWVDLETTGLDPHGCRILEWAALLAADDAAGDMTPVREYTGVVGLDAKAWEEAQAEMDPYVLDMHTKNGLLAECITGSDTLREAEDFLVSLAQELTGRDMPDRSAQIVLAGSTVHFDLGFIRVHMPRFAEWLSHRCFDVSTLKMAERDWGGQPFTKANAHRALADVRESLAHAKAIRERHNNHTSDLVAPLWGGP